VARAVSRRRGAAVSWMSALRAAVFGPGEKGKSRLRGVVAREHILLLFEREGPANLRTANCSKATM